MSAHAYFVSFIQTDAETHGSTRCVWGMCLDLCCGERGGEYQVKEKLALIPNIMYPSRPQAMTQLKSVRLPTKGRCNKGKTNENGHIR